MTVMVMVAIPVPPKFEAATVYTVAPDTAVGVPDMAPVFTSIVRPAGSAGLMIIEVLAPPVLTGVRVVIAVPLV